MRVPKNALRDKIIEIDKAVAVLNERTDLKFIALRDANEVSTKELARRLDILNGEAGRLRDMQATYIPREVYEMYKKETAMALASLTAFKNTFIGRQSIITVLVSAAISLLFVIFSFYISHFPIAVLPRSVVP